MLNLLNQSAVRNTLRKRGLLPSILQRIIAAEGEENRLFGCGLVSTVAIMAKVLLLMIAPLMILIPFFSLRIRKPE